MSRVDRLADRTGVTGLMRVPGINGIVAGPALEVAAARAALGLVSSQVIDRRGQPLGPRGLQPSWVPFSRFQTAATGVRGESGDPAV
jgi:hypothetical protein